MTCFFFTGNGPFTVNQTGAVLVASFNLSSVTPNTVYKLTVIASTKTEKLPQFSVPGCQCSNGSAVFVYVNVTSPTAGQQLVLNYTSYSNGSAVFVYENVTSPTASQQIVLNNASYNTCITKRHAVVLYLIIFLYIYIFVLM